jgi:hypothetical protein
MVGFGPHLRPRDRPRHDDHRSPIDRPPRHRPYPSTPGAHTYRTATGRLGSGSPSETPRDDDRSRSRSTPSAGTRIGSSPMRSHPTGGRHLIPSESAYPDWVDVSRRLSEFSIRTIAMSHNDSNLT